MPWASRGGDVSVSSGAGVDVEAGTEDVVLVRNGVDVCVEGCGDG
jgi:hypothetical protein